MFTALTIIFVVAHAEDKPQSHSLFGKIYEAWDLGNFIRALLGFDALLREAGDFLLF
jgi:hypothetical protein